MPILILAYILNYLDRNNVGFAALTMNQAIGLTATQFGFGAGVFFLGYCLLEIPSNIALYRVGARRWLSRIMISWGLASAATALAVGPQQLLRAASAARRRRGRILPGRGVLSRDVVSRAVPHADDRVVHGGDSGVVGHRWSDVRLAARTRRTGWACRLAVAVSARGSAGRLRRRGPAVVLADRPEDATWLTDEERRIVRERLAAEQRPRASAALLGGHSATSAC